MLFHYKLMDFRITNKQKCHTCNEVTNMNQREDLIEELNQLLKGTHMGAFIFEDLSAKITAHDLKVEFKRILKILKKHEEMLTQHITELDGEAVDTSGFMGTMTDMMGMIKNLIIVTDIQVIEDATKSIEMGLKALRDFDDKHFTLSQTMQKEIQIMKDDYSSIYHDLHKFLVEYK